MRNQNIPYLWYSAGVFLLISLWSLANSFGVPIRHLIADPAQVNDTPFYVGFLSNLTIVAWAAGTFVALFAAWLMPRIGAAEEWRRFFLLAGLLTLVLMLDDLYMFHEEVFPKYALWSSRTGIEPNEKFVIGSYGLFTLWFLYSSRQVIRKTPWPQLVVACCILSFGILADRGIAKLVFTDGNVRAFVEDGSKFLGVLGWSLYFISAAKCALLAHLPSTAAVTDEVPDGDEAIGLPATEARLQ